ncbi:sugar ABC transporter substrate-binding protein (plasmid) [Rhizobium sp. CC1099]|uniref:sugar ABC transporter substrate-binding protein n=1 Tax=Rhizobium sp. CC1099 TaxID=3039160 RepID=UPI0024B1FE35|nr:sugar ABC transporter substrate-binding protein [Rhizobium sp. CC1099]WFU91356.1 sugar ABC transporter substrate-binding protein [Rhizobium sp. CC1099]
MLIKTLFCTALSIGCVGSLAYAEPAGKKLTLLTGPTEDRLISAFSKAFDEKAIAAGMTVNQLTSPFDPALQAQQLDDAIGQKPDMIVLQPLSSGAVTPGLQRAKSAGVPVFLVISQVDKGDGLYVGTMALDDVRSGELAAEAMIAGLKAGGRTSAKVAAITGSLAEGIAPRRLEGFKARLAKEPWITLVQVEDAQWIPPVTEQVAGQIFTKYATQGGLDAIYGMNDAMANAIIQAADSAGIEMGNAPGQLLVIGGGCQESGIRNMQAGKQYATLSGPLPSYDGPKAAELISDYFSGKEVPKLSVTTPLEVISADNLEHYAAACSF